MQPACVAYMQATGVALRTGASRPWGRLVDAMAVDTAYRVAGGNGSGGRGAACTGRKSHRGPARGEIN